jgi:hypothetical protein
LEAASRTTGGVDFGPLIEEVRFAVDSPLEGDGFEPWSPAASGGARRDRRRHRERLSPPLGLGRLTRRDFVAIGPVSQGGRSGANVLLDRDLHILRKAAIIDELASRKRSTDYRW